MVALAGRAAAVELGQDGGFFTAEELGYFADPQVVGIRLSELPGYHPDLSEVILLDGIRDGMVGVIDTRMHRLAEQSLAEFGDMVCAAIQLATGTRMRARVRPSRKGYGLAMIFERPPVPTPTPE